MVLAFLVGRLHIEVRFVCVDITAAEQIALHYADDSGLTAPHVPALNRQAILEFFRTARSRSP
jgi:hypothetical protein